MLGGQSLDWCGRCWLCPLGPPSPLHVGRGLPGPHAFLMIRPGFLQSRCRSLRTEWTSGLAKLEWLCLVVLLVGSKARWGQWLPAPTWFGNVVLLEQGLLSPRLRYPERPRGDPSLHGGCGAAPAMGLFVGSSCPVEVHTQEPVSGSREP